MLVQVVETVEVEAQCIQIEVAEHRTCTPAVVVIGEVEQCIRVVVAIEEVEEVHRLQMRCMRRSCVVLIQMFRFHH